ncbi:helix-turn-helix domain-containing protein [Glutamicibacter creatinolyticus]|uniref:helix-turn-helix domain-containing protein n=1 Tax=Glutamicibacter creatinolyticus TaxID=162496 RepID=UPI003217854A
MTTSSITKPEDVVRAREEIGLSQQQLAQRLGVSVRTISRWETGTGSIPDDALSRIQRAGDKGRNVPDPQAVRSIPHVDIGVEVLERLRTLQHLEQVNQKLQEENDRYRALHGSLPL